MKPLAQPAVGPASALAVGEGGSCSEAMEMPAAQVCTPERERKRAWSWRQGDLLQATALDTDKNGGESPGPGLDFSLLGNKGISVFCRRDWLEARVTPASPNAAVFNKIHFPFPPIIVLWLCMAAGGRISLC